MDPQSVAIIGVAINMVIAASLLVVPRLRSRRRDSAAALSATSSGGGNRADPSSPPGSSQAPASLALDAAAPSFPARGAAPNGSGHAPSSTDPATGLDLASSWSRWLNEEHARVRRFHRPATIVLVELAGLDRLAERLGDEAAQRLIPPIAITMRRHARATDHLARLGPTRFGALLTETDEIRAINYVERVRAACDIWLEAGAVTLRLSIGWAQIGVNQPADAALEEAERRLFEERQRAGQVMARTPDDSGPAPAALVPSPA